MISAPGFYPNITPVDFFRRVEPDTNGGCGLWAVGLRQPRSPLARGPSVDNNADMVRKGRGRPCRREANGRSILAESQVERVRALLNGSLTLRAIGALFGVTKHPIWKIKHARAWRQI